MQNIHNANKAMGINIAECTYGRSGISTTAVVLVVCCWFHCVVYNRCVRTQCICKKLHTSMRHMNGCNTLEGESRLVIALRQQGRTGQSRAGQDRAGHPRQPTGCYVHMNDV